MHLVLGEVDKVRGSLLPAETCSSLDEVDIQFLLILGWLGSEEGNFWVGPESTNKHLNGLEDIRDPVFEGIAQSEDMNAPSDHIVVFNRVHVLPRELEVFSEREAVDVDAGSCTEHVSLSAELFSAANGEDLN